MTEQMKIEYLCENMGVQNLSECLNFPLYIQIEPNTACNARCRMCPRSVMSFERENKVMSPAIREKIVKELGDHAGHIRRVSVNGYGEPLLDKTLPDFIAKLKGVGIAEIFFSTNASLLDEEMGQRLLDSGVDQIDLSVDAFSAEIYETIRIGLSRDKVYKNIEDFIKLRDKISARTKVRFRYILQGINDSEFLVFEKYWSKKISKNDSISRKIQHTVGGFMEAMDSAEYKELMEKNAVLPCKVIFSSISITVTGDVSICAYDFEQKSPLGSVADKSISELWQSETLKKVRDAHISKGRKGYEPCINCNVWLPELKLS